MKRKRIYAGLLILCCLCTLAIGGTLAKSTPDPPQPETPLTVDALVSSKFSYQGMLRENSAPVTGTRDMNFHLYSNDTCTASVGGLISMPDVPVSNGLFNVELSVSQNNINGQGLWLKTEIKGTTVACQEILPVPFAFSLRPRAEISGERTNWYALMIENTDSSSISVGAYGKSYSTQDTAVLRN
jgi:hypothetical protein